MSFQLQYLQREIKIKGQTIQDMSEQNILLQQTLHHQQQMLQQETIRNGELEDSQIKLEKQVQYGEKYLYKINCLIYAFIIPIKPEYFLDNWVDDYYLYI